MAFDLLILGAVALSILFLAVLVWLMIRAGSQADWAAISQGVRAERDKRDSGRA
jgi:hypothetical protein